MNVLENAVVDRVVLLNPQTVQFTLDMQKNPGLTIDSVRDALVEYCTQYPTVYGWQTQFLGSQLIITVAGIVNQTVLDQYL